MKLLVAIALAFPICANAASLIAAEIGGQVQQFTDAGKVSGCGITFSATEKAQAGKALVFNGSAVIFKNAGALVKGRASQVDAKVLYSPAFTLRDLKVLKTTNVWMKAQSSPATTPIGEVKESEDKTYIIFSAQFDPTFQVIRAVLEGENIQIGMQVAGNKSEQVLFGTATISADERDQLIGCLKELTQ